jgi:hypothetical protein
VEQKAFAQLSSSVAALLAKTEKNLTRSGAHQPETGH